MQISTSSSVLYLEKLKRSALSTYSGASPIAVSTGDGEGEFEEHAEPEETIMEDADIGNRTGQWFWGMIVNLGLGGMYGANYDPVTVDQIISRFLDRAYDYDGKGGLFTVRAPRKDMRTVEIWYQMNWYLSETQ